MPTKDESRSWMSKFQQVKKQPEHQTAKANATPKMGQQAMKPGKSPLQRYMASKKKQYGTQSKSYEVGRTRRQA